MGLGAAALDPLQADPGLAGACRGLPGLAAAEFRVANFCAQAADIRAICPELEVHFLTKAQVLDGGVGVCPK